MHAIRGKAVSSPAAPLRLHRAGKAAPIRHFWSGRLSIGYTGTRPVMVFTAGAPGSGKTYTLHRLYGLGNLELLDLDVVMKEHPQYNAQQPEALYAKRAAYDWSNRHVETRFQHLCQAPRHSNGVGRLVCFDGTGTHVERQKRRMWEAKNAGYWVTQLYVSVSLETAIRRNTLRERTVPEDVLRGYIDRLDAAVREVSAEPGLVDEHIAMDNDREDEHASEEARWGVHLDWVQSASRRYEGLFGCSWAEET